MCIDDIVWLKGRGWIYLAGKDGRLEGARER